MENKLKGYQGIFLDQDTMDRLVELQERGLDYVIKDMHITFNFGELEQFPEELMSDPIKFSLIGYASDGKNSGFQVKLPDEIMQYYKNENPPHITVSLGEVDGVRGKAVDTGTMTFEPLEEPIEMEGNLGYYVYREPRNLSGKVMDNSIFKTKERTQEDDDDREI